MKTKTLGLFAIPVIAAIMIGAGASAQLAMADPDGTNPQTATITRDLGCLLYDGNDILVLADADKVVVTSSGNATLKCSGDVEPPADGKASVQKGFLCLTPLGLTNDSHSTVSASGHSTLTCRV